MRVNTKLTAAGILGVSLISSIAYSQYETCQSCMQLPPLQSFCPTNSNEAFFCGSEEWINKGNVDCKRFVTIVGYCSTGNRIVYTTEYWMGAGSYCSSEGENHDCQI